MTSRTIHFLSTNITKTTRSNADETNSRNGQLLTRAGFVSQMAAGIYTMMPLGMRVLSRIERIVADEMNALGAFQFHGAPLQTRQLLDTTGRWDSIDVLYRLTSRSGADMCLQATAEEAICAALRQRIASHRDLPLSLYQISDKFRDEQRPRAGLIRGRAFRMKDLYSLHASAHELDSYYEEVVKSYHRIFSRCGIGDKVIRTFASGGVFSKFSDEFQLIAESGEDTVFTTEDRTVALNKEVADDQEALRALFGERIPRLVEHRAIEVGNTFKLGTRYTDAFNISFQDKEGVRQKVWMASYGIGTTRLIGAIAEVLSDEHGLVWPREVSPYDVHVVVLGNESQGSAELDRIINQLDRSGISALVDARPEVRAGEKFADADLIGIPTRVVMSSSATKDFCIEVKRRTQHTATRIPLDLLSDFVMGA
jgi:prolyl-tRNA synthetase